MAAKGKFAGRLTNLEKFIDLRSYLLKLFIILCLLAHGRLTQKLDYLSDIFLSQALTYS